MGVNISYKRHKACKKILFKKIKIETDLRQRIKLYQSANNAKSEKLDDYEKKMKEYETENLMLKVIILFLFLQIICQIIIIPRCLAWGCDIYTNQCF